MTTAQERAEASKVLDEEIRFRLSYNKSVERIARELRLSTSAVAKRIEKMTP